MIFFSPFERCFHLFVNPQPVLDEPKNAHAGSSSPDAPF
jgi:hypothetical protein